MASKWIRGAAALALASLGFSATAATVNLNGWAYGDSWGNIVDVGTPSHRGAAGGFKGVVKFGKDGELDFTGTDSHFVTYCVEIEESFGLPSGEMKGYSVIGGGDYSKWTNANGNGKTAAATADRLGQLLSYVGSDEKIVDTDEESTSLQLAIWNVIYDDDHSVTGGRFSEKTLNGAFNAYANELLTMSMNWARMLDVFVLTKGGSQDFVLTRDSGRAVPGVGTSLAAPADAVPEPASLALVMLALGAAGVSSRRRRALV